MGYLTYVRTLRNLNFKSASEFRFQNENKIILEFGKLLITDNDIRELMLKRCKFESQQWKLRNLK